MKRTYLLVSIAVSALAAILCLGCLPCATVDCTLPGAQFEITSNDEAALPDGEYRIEYEEQWADCETGVEQDPTFCDDDNQNGIIQFTIEDGALAGEVPEDTYGDPVVQLDDPARLLVVLENIGGEYNALALSVFLAETVVGSVKIDSMPHDYGDEEDDAICRSTCPGPFTKTLTIDPVLASDPA